MAFPRSNYNVVDRQLQAFGLMSYQWWAELWKLTGYVLLVTSDVHDSTGCHETLCLRCLGAALPWLSWFPRPPQHIDSWRSRVPVSKSCLLWCDLEGFRDLLCRSRHVKGAKGASLALVVLGSICGLWWFPHLKSETFSYTQGSSSVKKNTSIKSSLPVGLVVFTKNGTIYHSSVFNDKPLQELSLICGLKTALHLALILLSVHLYPSPHQQFPVGIVILKM